MTVFPLTTEDVLASQDVLHVVRDQSDSFTAVEALEYRLAAEKVKRAAQEAIDFCNMQMVKLLDGQPAIIREGRSFWIGDKTEKEVVDHSAVLRHVRRVVHEIAEDREDLGEDGAHWVSVGAELGASVMRDLYLADGSRVKKGQLDRYGIPRNVIEVQRGERQVKEAPARGEADT